MERYEACSPLRPHFGLRCKKPAAKQKVAMQAGRQTTVTYRRQSSEGQTGNGQTQQPDRRWAYRQWWTSEGQTDNSRQAGPDKRLPDGRRQRPDRKVDSRSSAAEAGGAGLFIGSRRQPLHSRQIIPICSARPLIWH